MRAPLFVATVLSLAGASAIATADVMPPERAACQGHDAGDGCNAAGGAVPGTCQTTTCPSLTAPPDGGQDATTTACLECFAPAGSAEDGGASGASGGSSSSCSFGRGAFGRGGSLAGAFAIATLVTLLRARRRA